MVTDPAPDAASPEAARLVERHGYGALDIIAAHLNRADAGGIVSDAAFWEAVYDAVVALLTAPRVVGP